MGTTLFHVRGPIIARLAYACQWFTDSNSELMDDLEMQQGRIEILAISQEPDDVTTEQRANDLHSTVAQHCAVTGAHCKRLAARPLNGRDFEAFNTWTGSSRHITYRW